MNSRTRIYYAASLLLVPLIILLFSLLRQILGYPYLPTLIEGTWTIQYLPLAVAGAVGGWAAIAALRLAARWRLFVTCLLWNGAWLALALVATGLLWGDKFD